MSADVVEYGERMTGVRSDGLVFSSSSFVMKISMGLSSALIAWLLALSGYDGGLAVQSAVVVNTITQAFIWVPIAMCLMMGMLLYKYDLAENES
jgi:GPH family glycoside/pentoside/hexuronide:cation symporter